MAERSEPKAPTELADTPADLAYRALLRHGMSSCERCVANWRTCPTRRALAETWRRVRS